MKFYQINRIVIILFFFIAFFSCNDQKEIQESRISSHTIIESIHTKLANIIGVHDTLAMIATPRADKLVKIYNCKTGKKICNVGNKGKGPHEFISPRTNNFTNRLTIFDVNLKKIGIYTLSDSLLNNKNDPPKVRTIQNFKNNNWNRVIEYDYNKFIGLSYDSEQPFTLFNANKIIGKFGHFPIKEKITNKRRVFQGVLEYCPKKKLLLYSCLDVGYIALYKIKNDKLKFLWENYFLETKYNINNNKQLKWNKNQEKGLNDATISKDYIVGTLKKGAEQDHITKDAETAPKHMFVFDIKTGELQKKYILDYPVVFLSSNYRSNNAYCIGLTPDFSLLRYKLE